MPKASLYGYDTEAEDLARRQGIADALRQSSMQPVQGTTIGGMGASAHWTAGLAKMVEAYGANKKSKEVTAGKEALSRRYNEDLANGMQQYFKTSEGSQVPSMIARPNVVNGVEQGQFVKGDKKKAIFDALASGHPAMQQLAMAEMAKLGEGQMTAKDFAQHATPESILNSGGNPAGFKPKVNVTSTTPGNVLLDDAGKVFNPTAPSGQNGSGLPNVPAGATVTDQGPGWDMIRNPGGDLLRRSQTGSAMVDNAPKVNVTTNMPKPESEFMNVLGRQAGEATMDIFNKQKAAEGTMVLLDRLEELNANPTYSGPTANLAVGLGAFAKALGLDVDNEQLVNSEVYKERLAAQISSYLTAGAGVGRSLTDSDRKALEAQFPQLINTPEGRTRIIAQMRMDNQRDIEYGNATRDRLRSSYPEHATLWDVIPSGPGYTPPASTPQAGGAVETFDEYMARISGAQ